MTDTTAPQNTDRFESHQVDAHSDRGLSPAQLAQEQAEWQAAQDTFDAEMATAEAWAVRTGLPCAPLPGCACGGGNTPWLFGVCPCLNLDLRDPALSVAEVHALYELATANSVAQRAADRAAAQAAVQA